VIYAIYKSGVHGKLYRLLYLMNKDTIIKLKTGVGSDRVAHVFYS
jgi:hypothetical protein